MPGWAEYVPWSLVRTLPLDDPGTADHRSPARFLWWLAKGQRATLLGGMFFGIVWMSCQAILPAVLGRAIDQGVAARDTDRLLGWAGLMFAIGLLQAVSGVLRHRFAVTNWLTAAYRTVQLIGRQAVHLGGALPRKVSTGEVVTIGVSDVANLGHVMDVSARFAGAVVSFLLVSIILLNTSVPLGLIVLIGVPALMLMIGPLLSPLQRRTAHQRHLTGKLANTASDIVGGLRVLRGIGGEQVFADKYRQQSQTTRRAGVEVARLQSVLDALQVLLPGVFVVFVVWLGARYAVSGRITVGELVAFYGYSAFLVIPLRTATEYANKLIRARVSAERVCRVLALTPDLIDPEVVAPSPAPGAELFDARSGLRVPPGRILAIVTEQTDEAAELADRLGLSAAQIDDEVSLGGVPLTALAREEVRRRIVVSDTATALFSGPLGESLDVRPGAENRDAAIDSDLDRALSTASAHDIFEALPAGMATVVTERGRSFSGGQRQRLVLARALLRDPEILVLVEPTSAVDAHTEARIAARLRQHRAGRTTVITTSSPLLLDAVDEVAFVIDGQVAAVGTHRSLLTTHPAYRLIITRESEDHGPTDTRRSPVGSRA